LSGNAPAATLDRQPGLSVELVVCDHVSEMVELRPDLALRDGDIADSSFVGRKIAMLAYVVVAAPSYMQRHGGPRAPTELGRHTCIVQDSKTRRGSWEFKGPDGRISMPVSGQLSTNNECAALAMMLYATYPLRRQLALRTRTVLEFVVEQDRRESAA
jgi:DNA-binding transcriptional LysR family regulator